MREEQKPKNELKPINRTKKDNHKSRKNENNIKLADVEFLRNEALLSKKIDGVSISTKETKKKAKKVREFSKSGYH